MVEARTPDIGAELRDMRREIGELSFGIAQLVIAQETQTALLRELLAAATEGDGTDGGLTAALREIARALTAQGATLAGIRSDLAAQSAPGAR